MISSRLVFLLLLCSLNHCLLNPLIHDLFWKKTKDKNLNYLFAVYAQIFNDFAYSASSYVFTKGATIATLTPSYSGTIQQCSSSPELPDGLSLDSSTCAISGTPTKVQEMKDYAITAIGSQGKVSVNLNLTVRGLNSYKFSSATDRTGNTNINCSVQDEASGIGPYSFQIPYDEDVLITLTSNLRGPPAAWPTGGGHLNTIQLRLYIDGIMQQSLIDGRYYHQDTALGSAFITSLKKGDHLIELRFCGNNSYYPLILGTHQTILTVTSLMSISYFDRKFSTQLSQGSTNLPSSGSFTNIMNGSSPMALTYETTNNPILLWQSFALSSGVGVYGLIENFRLFPETSEDLSLGVDSYSPINKVTYHSLTANSSTTIQAQYSGSTSSSVQTLGTYDNTLNLIGFKVPKSGNYGKSVISSLMQTTSATFVPLITLNISNTYDAKYLISFSANQAQGNGAGDSGCVFGLTINGGSVIAQTLVDNDAGGSLRNGTLITVETIPAGDIPVQIQFKDYAPTNGCNVSNAVFTILPLE